MFMTKQEMCFISIIVFGKLRLNACKQKVSKTNINLFIYLSLIIYIFQAMACVPPPDVNFATMTNQAVCTSSSYGTKCFYQCKEGYKLTSNSRNFVQCDDTGATQGVWDLPVPKCECKYKFIELQEIKIEFISYIYIHTVNRIYIF